MHFLQQCFQLVLLAFQHFTHLLTEIWNLFLVLPLATAGSMTKVMYRYKNNNQLAYCIIIFISRIGQIS